LNNFEEGKEMKPNLIRFVTVFAAFAGCVCLVASGCNGKHYGEDGKPEEVKWESNSNTRWLAAAGSTFIQPLIDRWDNDYAKAHQLHINYLPVGSGGGIDRLRKGYGAFSVSDAPLSDDQLKELPPIVQLTFGQTRFRYRTVRASIGPKTCMGEVVEAAHAPPPSPAWCW
jgi:ABC-type phosphate transport system substrate-binding protein